MRGPPALVALVAGLTLLACYRPTLLDCSVRCGSKSECPASLTCHDGYCSAGRSCRSDGARESSLPFNPDAMDASDAVDLLDANDAPDMSNDAENTDAIDAPDSFVAGDAPQTSEAPDAPEDTGEGDRASDADPDVIAPALPFDLPGLILWLDPESPTGTDHVTIWQDRSPAHNDATAQSDLKLEEPMVVPGTMGRPPMIELSGEDQYFRLPTGMRDFTAGMSVFVVAVPQEPIVLNDANDIRFFDFAPTYGSLVNAIVFCRYGVDGNQILYEVFDQEIGSFGYVQNSIVLNDRLQLFEVVVSAGEPTHLAEFEYLKNGTHISFGASLVPRIVERRSNLIGRGNYVENGRNFTADYKGSFGDIVIYDRALSSRERRSIEMFLMERWQLR